LDKLTSILYEDLEPEVLEKMPEWFKVVEQGLDTTLWSEQHI